SSIVLACLNLVNKEERLVLTPRTPSSQAGLQFQVGCRLGQGQSSNLSGAILKYLMAETLELVGNTARDNKTHIIPCTAMLPVTTRPASSSNTLSRLYATMRNSTSCSVESLSPRGSPAQHPGRAPAQEA
ncbi:hypothetical protein AB205_0195160, partial [Aquarana catesbeiana]